MESCKVDLYSLESIGEILSCRCPFRLNLDFFTTLTLCYFFYFLFLALPKFGIVVNF